MHPDDEAYFEELESGLERAMEVARQARSKGVDPVDDVEIPIAQDMADRVENILEIDGVAERVRSLEADPSISREEAALKLAADFADGTVGDDDSRAGTIEGAVRTAVALLTEGVVAAPIEGIDRVEIVENDDGSEFVNVYYAGPIRSAGGTAQALSVLVADYTRTLLGIDEYKPRSEEVERYAEELALYDSETGLQYAPSDTETKFIARNLPIMLDGEPTGDEEVSGFRDLDRVDTNNPRGGMCLVLGEGIAQKAPKIKRYTTQLDEVDWPWLDDLIEGTYSDSTDSSADDHQDNATEESVQSDKTTHENSFEGPPRPDPSQKYLRDLIAGRPVFGHPSEPGGFRLRYGRARNHGFATAGVHPATMVLVDDFLAPGTQIKTERPGKAAGVVPVDTIDGPTVKLATGEVRQIKTVAEALTIRNGVIEILDLGEYLVNAGEFIENNHQLAPASYSTDWWRQDMSEADADVQALLDDPRVNVESPSPELALQWAETYGAPLHPEYTYLWHDISVEQFTTLSEAICAGHWTEADGAHDPQIQSSDITYSESNEQTLVLPRTEKVCSILEALLIEHTQGEDTITIPNALPFVRSLGINESLQCEWEYSDLSETVLSFAGGSNAIKVVNAVAPFDVMERAPTRIGCRMGRPEKSEKRELSPAVHTLFPIGEAGGSQRDVAAATEYSDSMADTPGELEVELANRRCPSCDTETFRNQCPSCSDRTIPEYRCPRCEIDIPGTASDRVVCPKCDRYVSAVTTHIIDINEEFQTALDAIGERENAFGTLKGVKGLSSEQKLPEPLEKGILRAKNDVSAFKDGTIRYDMTDLPVTAVRASELDVTVGQLRGLGYEEDIHGQPLEHADQLVELRVQDIVLSDGAAEHMLHTAQFVDDLLSKYYDLDPFYELEDRDDLVGELVFGMAPHTSAAVVGRVVGFTSASVGYAHPYFHAAKRRNCDGDEDCVMLLMDGLLNFSKQYLPDQRGGSVTADSRLIAKDPAGTIRFLTIEELWNELTDFVYHDGKFEKKLTENSGWETFVFDATQQTRLEPIERIIRYQASSDEPLITVNTTAGRSLTITKAHSLFRYRGEIEAVAGDALKEGDWILAPRSLSVAPKKRTLDMVSCIEQPTVVVEEGQISEQNERTIASGTGSVSLKTQSTVAIPFEQYLQEIGQPSDTITISRTGEADGISRFVQVDSDLGWVLGILYAAGQQLSTGISVSIETQPVLNRFIERYESAFGTSPSIEQTRVGWQVNIPPVANDLLTEITGTSNTANLLDAAPAVLLQAPKPVIAAFLHGLWTGQHQNDGGSDSLSLRFASLPKQVADSIVFLFHRLGETASIQGYHNEVVDIVVNATPNELRRVIKDPGRVPTWTSNRLPIPSELRTLRNANDPSINECIPQDIFEQSSITREHLQHIVHTLKSNDIPSTFEKLLDSLEQLTESELTFMQVDSITQTATDGYLYDLQVGGEPIFTANWLFAHNSMDAPLVMSSRIDPAEIDDEAHNMDITSSYPRAFFEATRRMADPDEAEDLLELAGDNVGSEQQYRGFSHTHDTSDIASGPDLSAYKTLESMMDKMDAQLELARKLRAVDETDVAERVIEYHFLPDLIGNLRAFSRQETRCLDCGVKYRRMPLTENCPACGGQVTLTVYEGSVNKYMTTARAVAEEFDCREYTKQRLEILDLSIQSIFEDDTNKQSGIADFM